MRFFASVRLTVPFAAQNDSGGWMAGGGQGDAAYQPQESDCLLRMVGTTSDLLNER